MNHLRYLTYKLAILRAIKYLLQPSKKTPRAIILLLIFSVLLSATNFFVGLALGLY